MRIPEGEKDNFLLLYSILVRQDKDGWHRSSEIISHEQLVERIKKEPVFKRLVDMGSQKRAEGFAKNFALVMTLYRKFGPDGAERSWKLVARAIEKLPEPEPGEGGEDNER